MTTALIALALIALLVTALTRNARRQSRLGPARPSSFGPAHLRDRDAERAWAETMSRPRP